MFYICINDLWLTKRQKKRPAAKAGAVKVFAIQSGRENADLERGNEGEDVTASVILYRETGPFQNPRYCK